MKIINNIKPLADRFKISILILIFYMLLNLIHVGCPIKFITGISCPGCGMTRAVLSAIQLHFIDAFYYHPLFVVIPFMLFLFLFEDYLRPGFVKSSWIIIILLFITVYVIRLLFAENDVVTIDFSRGLVIKLFHKIIFY